MSEVQKSKEGEKSFLEQIYAEYGKFEVGGRYTMPVMGVGHQVFTIVKRVLIGDSLGVRVQWAKSGKPEDIRLSKLIGAEKVEQTEVEATIDSVRGQL